MDDLSELLRTIDTEPDERPPFEDQLLDQLLDQLDPSATPAHSNDEAEVVVPVADVRGEARSWVPSRFWWLTAATAAAVLLTAGLVLIRPSSETQPAGNEQPVGTVLRSPAPSATVVPASSVEDACSRFATEVSGLATLTSGSPSGDELSIWLQAFDQLVVDLTFLDVDTELTGQAGIEIRGTLNQARAQSIEADNASELVASALGQWQSAAVGDLATCRAD